MNSDIILFNRTVKHSLSMSSTTLGENIRYFMFKYGIYMSEWYGLLSVLYGKLSPYLRVRQLDHRCFLSLRCFFV